MSGDEGSKKATIDGGDGWGRDGASHEERGKMGVLGEGGNVARLHEEIRVVEVVLGSVDKREMQSKSAGRKKWKKIAREQGEVYMKKGYNLDGQVCGNKTERDGVGRM